MKKIAYITWGRASQLTSCQPRRARVLATVRERSRVERVDHRAILGCERDVDAVARGCGPAIDRRLEREQERTNSPGATSLASARDVIEAMRAAQMVSTHEAAMECFRRAALGFS